VLKKIALSCLLLCVTNKAEATTHHKHHVVNAIHHKMMHPITHTSHSMKNISGIASYYGPGFWGHHTSSGKIMRPMDMTVAHKTLPLGTKLRVINKDNGRSVIVTVNDRGPYVGHRIIDLAERPARLLDMKKDGLARVEVIPLYIPDRNIMEVAEYEPRKARPHIVHH